jgi:hypothetical protein
MKKVAVLLALVLIFCAPLVNAELVTPMHPGPQNPLTDNLYDFRFVIENVLYELPTSLDTFTAAGWQVKDGKDIEGTLNPNQRTFSIRLVNNANFETKEMYVSFYNTDNCVKPISECPVGGLMVETAYGDKPQVAITLPKGIEKGVSSQEDIVEAFGTPTDIYEGSSYTKLTYALESYREVALYVEEGKLNKVDAENLVETENKSPVSQEVPQYILDYVAPTELGDDLTGFVVKYNGDLYQLPAPIRAFVANGYTLQEARIPEVDAKDSPFGGVKLARDNQTEGYYTKNYADVAVLAENCAVYELEASTSEYDKRDIELPGGIALGMAKADLEAIIGSAGFERTEADKEFRYRFQDDNRNEINIYVEKETEKIKTIEISVR